LSLDVSSTSTGWALWEIFPGNAKKTPVILSSGTIKTAGENASERLVIFESSLKTMLYQSKPSYVVIEDLNYTRNMVIVKVLSSFLGTAKKLCYEFSKREPELVSRTSVLKAILGKGNAEKEEVVKYVTEHYPSVQLPDNKSAEDICDAIITGQYYINNLTVGETDGE
jgi:Holliday junction resolvasome RuvABC endonuclease subunit